MTAAADDARGLTSVAQDYLKVIWNAQEWSGEKVSTKMLSERIGVSASTASESIRKLAEQGLVEHAKYGAVTLTERGRRAAVSVAIGDSHDGDPADRTVELGSPAAESIWVVPC